MLDLFVLGSVRASTDGCEHSLGGPKQIGLLARLIVAGGRALPIEQLINELWDGFPPRDPSHALQARISRLRSALSVDIEQIYGGYRIDPTQIRTDAAHFEQLYSTAQESLADRKRPQAAQQLRQALDLWQGQAFAGVPDIAALRAESVRLEKLWAAALSDRIDLDIALGRNADVISELHALLEEYPFAERHWNQLMTALYRDGRMQEALETFAKARSTFIDQLGVEPSGELSRLHMRILQEQSPDLLLRSPFNAMPGAPLAKLGVKDIPPSSLSSNQPDILTALVQNRKTVLLTGSAGIGKTHLLRSIATQFEAQNCSVSLLTASPLSQAVPLGIFTGILPENRTSPAALIDHFTRHRSTMLLLVDNVDQLDEASLFVIGRLIHSSHLPTILTTRELASAPDEIRALYDSGEITEIAVTALSAAGADELVAHTLGGTLTPETRPRIFNAARGIPLHLREILTASVDDGRLVRTPFGWELHGDPASTTRLSQLVGERFSGLDDAGLEAAAKIAIAGEYPPSALDEADRRSLARAGVIEYSAHGWLRLSHPLDKEFLCNRCSPTLWSDLSREVLNLLFSDAIAKFPAVRRRAHILALDLGEPIDITSTLEVAEHALGAFDERLALRAAQAVITQEPDNCDAHRIAGLAASELGKSDEATEYFHTARHTAKTAAEQTRVALAHARHLGLRHHDAAAALAVIHEALIVVQDPNELGHLQRDAMRWSVIAGQTSELIDAPEDTSQIVATLGLITVGVSGVITGPLSEAEQALSRLQQLPDDIVALVPGGASLIELTRIMALSYTGDITATRRELHKMITETELLEPESLGVFEYALGFTELFSGDAEQAYAVATSAMAHLEWRDTTGLLPAAQALHGAAARATGREDIASMAFKNIPITAETDPKVVMLRAWDDAWRDQIKGHNGSAARRLLDAARWLLNAQHNYFAGMLAHCVARLGEHLVEAQEILTEVCLTAGGGLLEFYARHCAAVISGNSAELNLIAREAGSLGLQPTAADTQLLVDRIPRALPVTHDSLGVHHIRHG